MGLKNIVIKDDILAEKMSSRQDGQGEEMALPHGEFEYGSFEWWQETVDVVKLEELFRSFARLFQVGVCLMTPKGQKVILVNASEFCDYVHSIRKGKATCDACDKRAIRASLKQGDK